MFEITLIFNFILLSFFFGIIYTIFYYYNFNDENYFDIYFENNEFHCDPNHKSLMILWSTNFLIFLIRLFFLGF